MPGWHRKLHRHGQIAKPVPSPERPGQRTSREVMPHGRRVPQPPCAGTVLRLMVGQGSAWLADVCGTQATAGRGYILAYFQVGFDAPFQGLAVPGFNNQIDSFVGDPRTFGATLRVKF